MWQDCLHYGRPTCVPGMKVYKKDKGSPLKYRYFYMQFCLLNHVVYSDPECVSIVYRREASTVSLNKIQFSKCKSRHSYTRAISFVSNVFTSTSVQGRTAATGSSKGKASVRSASLLSSMVWSSSCASLCSAFACRKESAIQK